MSKPSYFVLRSDAVSSGRPELSEDRVGILGAAAWAIDGATQVEPGGYVPAPSEGTWIAEAVDQALRVELSKEGDKPLPEVVSGVALAVRKRLSSLDFPSDRVPPTCSIGIVRIDGPMVYGYTLGDVSIIVTQHDEAVGRLFDSRFLRNESRAVQVAEEPNAEDPVEGILRRRKSYIAGDKGPVVLSANPEAAGSGMTSSWTAEDVADIVVATDGFMRGLDSYPVFAAVTDLVASVRSDGVYGAMSLLRDYEQRVRGEEGSDFFKSADDAAAIHLEVRQ
jgi:Protein phosphatase 2C